MSTRRFVADLRAFAGKLGTRADVVVRDSCFDVAENIVVGGEFAPGTPIITGFARNSWVSGINTRPAFRQPSAPAKDQGPVPQTALSEVLAVLAGVRAGDVVHLESNCAYMNALEDGHSQQSPAGMVRQTLRHWLEIVRRRADEAIRA